MTLKEDGKVNMKLWYNLNKDKLPTDAKKMFDEKYELLHFAFDIYRNIMELLPSELHNLMLEQYPVFKTETRRLVLDYINNIETTVGYSLLFKLFEVMEDQRKGINFREKYPKFDSWVEFYARPRQPNYIKEESRFTTYKFLTDTEWEELKESENRAFIQFHNWLEGRIAEFIDVMQTIILKNWPELLDLEPDAWILYAVSIRDEYEYYVQQCEHVEAFIDYNFPEEYMKLSVDEYDKKRPYVLSEESKYVQSLRSRRIAGEKI